LKVAVIEEAGIGFICAVMAFFITETEGTKDSGEYWRVAA